MQAASVADEVLIQLGENVQMCIGTREKPNVRINLKGNAKYVYDRQLSMSTCTYTKELLGGYPKNSDNYPNTRESS
jgi:hypothetical protein